MHSKTIANLKVGEKGIIYGFLDAAMSLKLLEMGCLPGTEVKLDFIAPLGCPVGISVSEGYHLSLRKKEAATIIIE
jgi:ferrous iron transport protein A